jgi:hypothetical protein
MRIITDPIVDSVMYIVTALMIPLIIRFLRKILDILMTWSLFLIAVVLGKHRADKAFEMTSSVVCISLALSPYSSHHTT